MWMCCAKRVSEHDFAGTRMHGATRRGARRYARTRRMLSRIQGFGSHSSGEACRPHAVLRRVVGGAWQLSGMGRGHGTTSNAP
eukprot:59568-Chlamydomonas_euryale.AAC.4